MKNFGVLILMIVLSLQASAQTEERMLEPPAPPVPVSPRVPIAVKEIVDFPDVDASFPGGNHLLKTWIAENLQYPEISRELGDQGRVYVTFIVEIDGSITGVDVVEGGVTPELNREAKRLVRSMPTWEPSEANGQKVRARCRVPVTFILENEE